MKALYYVTYLPKPELHSNRAASYAGIGWTAQASRTAAVYWPNQWPWVLTVPASRAPAWAIEQAEMARVALGRRPLLHDDTCNCSLCQDADTNVTYYAELLAASRR